MDAPTSTAAAALDDAGLRLKAVLENATVSVFLMDDRQQCIYMNRAAERLTGFTLGEVLELDRPLHDIIHYLHPDGRPFPLSQCAIDRAFPERHQMQGEEVFVHRDGHFYPVAFTASPIHDEVSTTIGTIIEVRDITQEKEREAEARERERLLSVLGEYSADLLYLKDAESRMLYASAATLATVGKSLDEVLGKTDAEWSDHPGEAAAILANDRRVLDTLGPIQVEECFTGKDGVRRYYRSTKSPVFDDSGKAVGIVGVTTDISNLKLAEERQSLLLNELNHRVKNMLATVQSIAFQSFKGSDPGAVARFDGRLNALASAHNILTSREWESAPLNDVIASSLAPFGKDRFDVSGVGCDISAKAAVSLSMVLHELATNAVKYGALRNSSGRVAIEWTCDTAGEDQTIALRWRESGGPEVVPPTRRGFGTRLIERQLGLEFKGQALLDFRPEGLACEMVLRMLAPASATPVPPPLRSGDA